jgi:hypothetical protein
MRSVTSEWLNERGDLHDARVVDTRIVGSVLQIALDDEWASLRGSSQSEVQEAPGILILEDFLVTHGEPMAIEGGWISEVKLCGDQVDLVFCDRPPFAARICSAWWRSAPQLQRI